MHHSNLRLLILCIKSVTAMLQDFLQVQLSKKWAIPPTCLLPRYQFQKVYVVEKEIRVYLFGKLFIILTVFVFIVVRLYQNKISLYFFFLHQSLSIYRVRVKLSVTFYCFRWLLLLPKAQTKATLARFIKSRIL